MDSDSDSDGSHISATPPRDPFPPPPPPKQVPRQVPPSSSSGTKPKAHTQRQPGDHSEEAPVPSSSHPPPPPPSLFTENLPFRICETSNRSKPASFSSFNRLTRASEEIESKSDSQLSEVNHVLPQLPPPKLVRRKPPNLITDSITSQPVKAPVVFRSGGEGNFVKLNLNGKRGKKFPSKYKKSASKYRGKRYKKSEAGGEGETWLEEESDLQREEDEASDDGFISSVDDAVLAVKTDASDENLTKLLSLVFGYDSFRDGQLQAIKMVLAGSSTMLVLPTGAGKSLCYQIPAVVLPGITLVVSPLVSLMIDQLKHLPSVVKGGLLSSSQRPEEATETLRKLKEGIIKVLFVSPERLLNVEFLSMFRMSLSVSLVVVDEAHCVSEWSHNFRPSYMRLKASMLYSALNADCILAMTATATTMTLQAVMSALEIPSTNLIQKSQLRDNFELSVSLSGANRLKDLLILMESHPYKKIRSIIVYCKFQYETDMISKYLRDNNITAKGYHSGLPAKDRVRIQESFCSNKIRVVVATVAFGMGLDKGDVGAVIHFSVPGSLEEYVQEIGRAGRDGRLSYCHLFYDEDTYLKLRSLSHSDGVDEYAVGKFLTHVFSSDTKQHEKICSIVIESASHKFDMKEEVMQTILTHLELGEVQYLRMLPQVNVCCTLNFHKSSPNILAARNIIVATILKKSHLKQGLYVFDIPTVASSTGVATTDVLAEIQTLKMKGEVTYETKDPAFCYTILESPKEISSLSSQLTKWLAEVESCKVRKLDIMSSAAVAAINVSNTSETSSGAKQTLSLQSRILDYFNGDESCDIPSKTTQNCSFLRADIKVFLQSNRQAKFTPRAIARIMNGVGSPAFPNSIWSKTHFWGRYMSVDFRVIMEAAQTELMNFVDRNAALAT
ncbi:ATP-dependent DNA helicase Q-like 5 [Raphanus sativus]|uniref:DNA 3'-5' helicase n=1 Tax=Raphanus sativus TaxID=3726 RepID=A0A6J0NS42_RAPSA|nr:ATP-dependent DNA helicase Q-like 5 [Raphanus sativus]KAJ4894723.1 ATP-dependent DNA helicase Q-like 5 [Raphanus sativus]